MGLENKENNLLAGTIKSLLRKNKRGGMNITTHVTPTRKMDVFYFSFSSSSCLSVTESS